MKYYCIGIKGTGMATLASILSDLGNEVEGYDDNRHTKFTEEGLKKRNIPIYYEPHNLDKDVIVTFSRAFSEEHPEIKRVRSLGLKVKSYNEVMGDLTKEFETIGVSGTHGKTTTSYMIAHLFKDYGINYFVGDGSGYASLDNKLLVMESDEFNKHFLSYYPNISIINNIELDHTECYPHGISELKDAFKEFANKGKTIIAWGDSDIVRSIEFNKKPIYFGLNHENDIYPYNIHTDSKGSYFDVKYFDQDIKDIFLPLFGNHMILNATVAVTVAKLYNLDDSLIRKKLSTFITPKRRFKIIDKKNIKIVDDYAHHPTEIKATLDACFDHFPGKEVVAVFLPNSYYRNVALEDDFVKALSRADKTYVMEILSDREKKEDFPNVSSKTIVDKIANAEMIDYNSVDKLLRHKNAVIVFMSCTNIYELMNKYIELLDNDEK